MFFEILFILTGLRIQFIHDSQDFDLVVTKLHQIFQVDELSISCSILIQISWL